MDATHTKTQHGYLVLADISGFTAYLAEVELEHAHEILQELLELIVSHLRPLLTLAQVEGDAVLTFAPEAGIPRGETLLELIEAAYMAFRDRVEAIRRRTTCTCAACQAVPGLDLKFLAHHGQYIAEPAAAGYELMGLDVSLVRDRLLKAGVVQATGWKGFALFTQACLAHMGLQLLDCHIQAEAVEPVGEVKTYSLNLQRRYTEMLSGRRVFVEPEHADAVVTRDVAGPPPVVWEWLNDPEKRSRWMSGRSWTMGIRPGGRTGPGARNHCAHGLGTVIETILDWKPFDYFTVEITPPSGNLTMRQTYLLEPLPGGLETRVHSHIKVAVPLPDWLGRPLSQWGATRLSQRDLAKMARLMADERGDAALALGSTYESSAG